VGLLVNGVPVLEDLAVGPVWMEGALSLPDGVLHRGVNVLTRVAGARVLWDFIELDGSLGAPR